MIKPKKKVLWIILFLSILILPSVLAERHVGTNYTVVTEQYESCHQQSGVYFSIIYCISDVPETMHEGSTFHLRNFFYWLAAAVVEIQYLALGVVLSIISVAGLFAFLPKYLDEEHTPIKLLFIVGALLLCLVLLAYIAQLVILNQALPGGSINQIVSILTSGYQVILWTVIFTLAWFIIYFMWKSMMAAKPVTK